MAAAATTSQLGIKTPVYDSKMGLRGILPPLVTVGYGAWLRTQGTWFESDQIQGAQKASVIGTFASIAVALRGRHQLNRVGGVVVLPPGPVAGFVKG